MKTVTARTRPRSSTVSYYAKSQRERMPRRTSEADARERYRKQKYGQPGPVDAWLAARQSQNQAQSQSQSLESQNTDGTLPRLGARQDRDASADQVRCTAQVQCIKAPSDGTIFRDSDTFVLHLTTTTTGAARRLGQGDGVDAPGSRRVELGKYVGLPESLDAPEWVRCPMGQPVEFQASAAAVAEVLRYTASWKEVMAPLLESLRAVTLDG
ncbi:hypothetical protein LXA43DRAFT_1065785 [Ganoderma leucocontextum]|nr:hypothetical protein LXA43DRAFT_1065785 [Ganoderma leucocontextum]